MSKKTTYLFGVLASLIIGSFLHFSLCAHTDEITKPAVITKGEKKTTILYLLCLMTDIP